MCTWFFKPWATKEVLRIFELNWAWIVQMPTYCQGISEANQGQLHAPKTSHQNFEVLVFCWGNVMGKKHMTFLSPTSQVGRTCTNNFINGAHSSINLGTGACCHLVRCRIDANKSATDTFPIANIPLAITWVRASASMMPELAQNWSKSAAHTQVSTPILASTQPQALTGRSTQNSQLLCT